MYIKIFISYSVPSDKPNVHEETIQAHALMLVYIRKKTKCSAYSGIKATFMADSYECILNT